MHLNGEIFEKLIFLETIEAKVIILSWYVSSQRHSHLFLVGAAELERQRRESILGGTGASPTENF